MTENTTTENTTPQPAADVESEAVETETPANDVLEAARRDPARKARQEAANLRQRLHDTDAALETLKAEQTTLRGAHDALLRGVIADAASGPNLLRDGNDLFLTGIEVADLLGDDGLPDNEKVSAAVAATLADHPGWRASGFASHKGPKVSEKPGMPRRADGTLDGAEAVKKGYLTTGLDGDHRPAVSWAGVIGRR